MPVLWESTVAIELWRSQMAFFAEIISCSVWASIIYYHDADDDDDDDDDAGDDDANLGTYHALY